MILLCSLVIIVFVHELGHLLVAKLCKCQVEVFSVGFGQPFFSKKIGSTVYQITPFLLGGFCQLKDELIYSRSKKSFTNKTYIQKVIISLAGIGMNCWTGLISYWIFLQTGNIYFAIFFLYSTLIGLSNIIPCPALDGFYPILFLFEKKWGKKKTYAYWSKVNSVFFKWIMILNIFSLPYLIWLIYKGKIL
jgi:membrane-associated protease RseP (regulator of RpoE activity)